jgi:hypothetical protein
MSRESGQLFVSFWHLCLDNIPEGAFTRRRVDPGDAKTLIDEARADSSLRCASEDDLFAPYNKREARNHKKLCQVLAEHFGIEVSIRDFVNESEIEGEPSLVIHPLCFVEVKGRDRLLVVTCNFARAKERGDDLLAFDVAPDSVCSSPEGPVVSDVAGCRRHRAVPRVATAAGLRRASSPRSRAAIGTLRTVHTGAECSVPRAVARPCRRVRRPLRPTVQRSHARSRKERRCRGRRAVEQMLPGFRGGR